MNPTDPRIVRVEALADLPVLWAIFARLDLPATLDRHFPAPLHWKGPLTPGEVLAVWLLFLLSHLWFAPDRGWFGETLGDLVIQVRGQIPKFQEAFLDIVQG